MTAEPIPEFTSDDPPEQPHHLRTIRDIRASLPEDQLPLFDSELAETDISDLESMLTRWATLGNDGFHEFLRSTPFEGLEFGARSYDDEGDGR